MAFPTQDNYLQQDVSRIYGEVYRILRAKGRVSALIEKGEIPTGMGYNYITPIYQRAQDTGANDWTDVQQETGTGNNCVQPANTYSPASQQIAWTVQEMMVRSVPICFEDLRRAYNGREQLSAWQDDMAALIIDKWENKDNERFFNATGHKIIANSSLTENVSSTQMPLTAPTTRAVQTIFDILQERIANDGGCEESYAHANGQPLITMILSSQQHRNIIKEDSSTRQDFNYADMGAGDQATMLKSWLGDMKAYSGYMHVINILQPRYDWVNSVWVKRDYYSTSASTIGNAANVSIAYQNAAYEDVYLWHPKVVKRNMPRPNESFGSKTAFNPVKWNGEITWVNAINLDESSSAYNPLGNIGRYYCAMQAGWQQVKPQYGYAVRVQRCARFTASACY